MESCATSHCHTPHPCWHKTHADAKRHSPTSHRRCFRGKLSTFHQTRSNFKMILKGNTYYYHPGYFEHLSLANCFLQALIFLSWWQTNHFSLAPPHLPSSLTFEVALLLRHTVPRLPVTYNTDKSQMSGRSSVLPYLPTGCGFLWREAQVAQLPLQRSVPLCPPPGAAPLIILRILQRYGNSFKSLEMWWEVFHRMTSQIHLSTA